MDMSDQFAVYDAHCDAVAAAQRKAPSHPRQAAPADDASERQTRAGTTRLKAQRKPPQRKSPRNSIDKRGLTFSNGFYAPNVQLVKVDCASK